MPAILVGVRGVQPDLVREFAREEILELAFALEDPTLIANTSAAFVEFLAAEGHLDEASALIGRALTALPSIGAASVARRVGRNVRPARGRGASDEAAQPVGFTPIGNAIGRAYCELANAVTMRRYRTGSARDAGAKAAGMFGPSGLRYLRARALELAGDVSSAREGVQRHGRVAR